MHELSLAMEIIRIADEQAVLHQANGVEKICVEIGQLAGVEIEALKFALEHGRQNTVLQDAEITYRILEGRGKCQTCDLEFSVDTWWVSCPICGSSAIQIVQGDEFRVRELTLILPQPSEN